MYLSSLLIDVGENPDRPRPGRLWLRNRYHVHQRLCMGFPSASQKEDDPEYLKPYDPQGFSHVHSARSMKEAFLFRIDPLLGNRVMVLLQSAIKPDWNYAFHNAQHLLAAPPEVKPIRLDFRVGQSFRFRLEANPTMRLRKGSRNTEGVLTGDDWVGKRVPVSAQRLEDWLIRRAERLGFRVHELTGLRPGYVYFNQKAVRGEGQRLRSARYDGTLEVVVPEAFQAAVVCGIGSAKAFGFGLLSLAPVR